MTTEPKAVTKKPARRKTAKKKAAKKPAVKRTKKPAAGSAPLETPVSAEPAAAIQEPTAETAIGDRPTAETPVAPGPTIMQRIEHVAAAAVDAVFGISQD